MILTDDLIPDSPTSMAEQQPGNDFFFLDRQFVTRCSFAVHGRGLYLNSLQSMEIIISEVTRVCFWLMGNVSVSPLLIRQCCQGSRRPLG